MHIKTSGYIGSMIFKELETLVLINCFKRQKQEPAAPCSIEMKTSKQQKLTPWSHAR